MLNIKAKSFDRLFNITVDLSRGYFSITGKMYEYTDKDEDRFLIAAGAIADDFAKYKRQYKDLCDMHLRNLDGSPMHALANSCYYLDRVVAGEASFRDVALSHFQINADELNNLLSIYKMEGRTGVSTYIDNTLRQRWQAHAAFIINKYNLQ